MRRVALAAGLKSGRHPLHKHKPPSSSSCLMPKLHLSRRIQHALTGLILLLISYIIYPFPLGFVLLSMATGVFYHVHTKRVHDEAWDEWYLEQFGALLREHEKGEWEGKDGLTYTSKQSNKDTATGLNESSDKQQQQSSNPTPISSSSSSSQISRKRRRRKIVPALPGAFYFLLGTTLSTLLFPAVVARTSLLIVSIADPVAGVVGVYFSKLGYNIMWRGLFNKLVLRKTANMEGGPSVAGSLACMITTIMCTFLYIDGSASGALLLSLNSRLCIGAMTAITEAVAGRHLPLIGTVADDNLLMPLVSGSLICWFGE